MKTKRSDHPVKGASVLEDARPSTGQFESKAGYSVLIESDRWKLSKDVVVNLQPIVSILDSASAEGFRLTLSHYARQYSAHHVSNVADQLLRYLRSTGSLSISAIGLTNYRGSLPRKKEWWLGVLKGFLKSWFDLGYPGVETDVIEVLDGWRLRGNEKGSAVRSLDPKEGPLDDIELEGLNTAAGQLFEQGAIDLAALGQALLLTHLGARPVQVSHLKIKDLVLGQKGEESSTYIVMMPQAKRQAEGAPFREKLKPKKVRKQLWEVLQLQARSVTDGVAESVAPLTSVTVGELPLFPNTEALASALACGAESELLPFLRNDQLHIRTAAITDAIRKIVRLGNVRGRDGSLLTISPRRLRYTTGSRAAREGFGKWVIANLLDHSDTQNAGVYTDNHPNFTKVIDSAMSRALAPLAQAYMGTLVTSKAEARFGSDPRQQITDGVSDVGVCGSHGYCGALAPIACYTCIHFQPLLDAPHSEILERLLLERERLKQYVNEDDDVVVGATDRTILAVSQVITLCKERSSVEEGPESASEGNNG